MCSILMGLLIPFFIFFWLLMRDKCDTTRIISQLVRMFYISMLRIHVLQWWFMYPVTFVSGQYFWIYKFYGLLNRPLVRTWELVPTLFVGSSEISGLSEPGLMNHHCTHLVLHFVTVSGICVSHYCLFYAPLWKRRCILLCTCRSVCRYPLTLCNW